MSQCVAGTSWSRHKLPSTCDRFLIDPEGFRPNQGLFGTHKVPSEGHWLGLSMKVQPSCILMQLRGVSAASDATFSAEALAHRHREVRISQVDRESLAELRQSMPSAPALQRPTAALRPLAQEGQRLLEELSTSIRPGRRRTCPSPSAKIDSAVIPGALSERSASGAAAGARQRPSPRQVKP